MKCIIRNIIMCGFVIISAFSCEEDESALADDPNIEFQFRLLNEDGEPSTTFQQGENFVFSFLIINNTERHYRLSQSSLDQSEFFKVYEYDFPSLTEENKNVAGKPYSVMFCNKINGIAIPPKDTLKIEIPWMPQTPWEPGVPYYSSHFCKVNDQSPLKSGKYKTGFSSKFELIYDGNSFLTNQIQFDIEFIIEQ